jgi:hypothetical protein
VKYRSEVRKDKDVLLEAWEGENKAVVKFHAMRCVWDYQRDGQEPAPYWTLFEIQDDGTERQIKG